MLRQKFNTAHGVQVIPGEGLFVSKSGGAMNVPFNWPIEQVNKYLLQWDETTVGKENADIRGLRTYTVEDIITGQTGAQEMHRVRREIIYTIKGRVEWTFEDIWGDTVTLEVSTFETTGGRRNCQGVIVPPYVMHTYKALELSTLFVVANALFHPADLIGMEEFRQMQKELGGVA